MGTQVGHYHSPQLADHWEHYTDYSSIYSQYRRSEPAMPAPVKTEVDFGTSKITFPIAPKFFEETLDQCKLQTYSCTHKPSAYRLCMKEYFIYPSAAEMLGEEWEIVASEWEQKVDTIGRRICFNNQVDYSFISSTNKLAVIGKIIAQDNKMYHIDVKCEDANDEALQRVTEFVNLFRQEFLNPQELV